MLDEVLSKELKSDEIQSMNEQDVEKVVSTFKRLRYKYKDKIHDAEIKVYSEIADSLFEMRLIKAIEGKEIKESFDSCKMRPWVR
ncbi:hypothetical protein [Metallosphaera hakonensis]|uniref:hypothetical protein n=1 Tax=Metallosphaera hakonensis TaxID=79601 RepID=UPI0006D18D35|nr:hypothetical protein [Metallosphaera hakonensis]